MDIIRTTRTWLILCLVGACQQPPPRQPTSTQSFAREDGSRDSSQQDRDDREGDTNDDDESGRPLHLDEVQVRVTRDIKIERSGLIDGVRVPIVELDWQGAEYAQILRCVAGYELETTTGESIRSARKRADWRKRLKSAWVSAWNDSGRCQVVGEYIMAGRYPDIASDSGAFYYVINPCISKERSTSHRDECSYDLVTTADFEYESALESRLRDKARELSAAESHLKALIGELGFIIEKFKINLRACEDMVAHERKMLAFKRGMLQMGFFIAGIAAGGVMGLNMGIMVGQMAQGIGAQMVGTIIFKWPFTIANTCLDPNYAGPAETKDGIKSVTPLYQRMIDLLSTEIGAATNRVQQVQQEMAELNEAIVTYDEMVVSASSKGIDLMEQDASTGLPAGIPGITGMLPGE